MPANCPRKLSFVGVSLCVIYELWSIERCSIDQLTTMLENGASQKARFYFPAFRFIQQQNRTVSTYYLHCIIRLCKPGTCSTFKVGGGAVLGPQTSHLDVHGISWCSRLIRSSATGSGGVWGPRVSRESPLTRLCSQCQSKPRQTCVCCFIQIYARRSSRHQTNSTLCRKQPFTERQI